MQNLDSNPTIFLTEHQIEIILFCAFQNPNKSKYGRIKILVSLFSTKNNVARPFKCCLGCADLKYEIDIEIQCSYG